MTDKELVINIIRKLPEDTSIEQIFDEIEIIAAIRRVKAAADAGQITPHEDVKKMVAAWN